MDHKAFTKQIIYCTLFLKESSLLAFFLLLLKLTYVVAFGFLVFSVTNYKFIREERKESLVKEKLL